ncbi:TetR/AcrR family transcriptional regulator [Reichenbachiella ulvae]|uniref:TetR/AcrR family transcriptional regulator n=1 Tax=Reichenbachiella ulvae TaxID=2980104 RepID=A0ABT3CYF4_9BACT|nr:TetR/AcrR family transcriptional regulator [Reichenbachiella ulvae]MCV9388731.1 TetR/AcrR family transcriptional regulator [Reichenbachiella ulvae]
MSPTREKILDKALALFNENGLASVSQRNITEALGISPGNLTYHFKKKEDIVQGLYDRLVIRFSEVFDGITKSPPSINGMLSLSETVFQLVWEYQFFFIDYVFLMRSYPAICTHYSHLMKKREEQFLASVEYLKNEGVLRPERLPKQYNRLFFQLRLITDFFLSAQLNQDDQQRLSQEYLDQVIYLIYPYLTEKGEKELSQSGYQSLS